MGRSGKKAPLMEAYDAGTALDGYVAELRAYDMDPPSDELRLAREIAVVAVALRQVAAAAADGEAEALMARICGRLETIVTVVRAAAAGEPAGGLLGRSWLVQSVELSVLLRKAAEILERHRA